MAEQDLDKLRELAMSARDAMKDEAYLAAIDIMQKQYTTQLIAAKDMNETLELVAKLKVLHDVGKGLTKLVNDYVGAIKRQPKEVHRG